MRRHADFTRQLLPKTATIRDAMRVMTAPGGTAIVMVTGPSDRLLGVVVDSDLRKAMLKGLGLDTPLAKILNPKPFTLPHDLETDQIRGIVGDKPRALIPLVDKKGRVRGLVETMRELARMPEHPNWVVLMVGGQGRRLRPLTEDKPKPLLTVGDRPILETIIQQFTSAGFRRFILSVNHHSAQIRRHFGEGKRFGAEIRYVNERKRLGTAGALSLIKRKFSAPVIVMNGDVLTKVDFQDLLTFHEADGHKATVCVREYDFQVPYGVIDIEGHHLRRILEKPTHRFFVNAGIYVLDPSVLPFVPRNKRYDMPALIEKIRKRKESTVGCFPIREYWIDIGRLPDYHRAQKDFGKFF